MRKPAILLFIALALAACKTTQPPSAIAPESDSPIHREAELNAEAVSQGVIGTWRIANIQDLYIPDPSLRGIENELIAKMVSTSRIEIRPDSTYTDNSFEGVETGIWRLNELNHFYKIRDSGGVDTLKFSRMTDSELNGTFGTAEGATAKFTLLRVK